jgi:hypothetical protein
LKEVLESIRIIPIKKTLRSEDTIRRQARKLANYMEHDGMQRDPIVVAPEGDRYIALDGMHRVEALKVMGCRDLLAYIVDYDNHRIFLESWDALVSDCPNIHEIVEDEFRGTDYVVDKIDGTGRDAVMDRRSFFTVVEKEGASYGVGKRGRERILALDELIGVLLQFEKRLDREGARIRYVANTNSDGLFEESRSEYLVIRPRFTKTEVRERSLEGKLFPRKTTRHVIYERPLRVGVALSILKQDADIEVKNEILQADLRWRHEHGRIRFYPEPIILFDE